MDKCPLQQKGVMTVFHFVVFNTGKRKDPLMTKKKAAISKVARVFRKVPKSEKPSSKRPVSAQVITIKQAKDFGLPRFFKTGGVEGIILHNQSEVSVQDFFHIEKGQAVVKDGKGKRRSVPISSMRAFRVGDELVKRTAAEAARKVALEAARKKTEERANRRKAAETAKTMI
jgi:hypothetical protein